MTKQAIQQAKFAGNIPLLRRAGRRGAAKTNRLLREKRESEEAERVAEAVKVKAHREALARDSEKKLAQAHEDTCPIDD